MNLRVSLRSGSGMFYPSVMDTCSATERDRGKLYICELPLNHQGKQDNHRDGDHEWTRDKPVGGNPDDRVFEG